MKMNNLYDIQKKLNDRAIVPESYYRRNALSYPLNCYVNQITGLLISEDYDTIPVVIGRIDSFFNETQRNESVPQEYRELVEQYVEMVKSKLKDENLLGDFGESYRERVEGKQTK